MLGCFETGGRLNEMKKGWFGGWGVGLVTVLAIALAIVFVSCDRDTDLPDNKLSGEMVPVRIHSVGMGKSGGSENLTRSSLEHQPEIVSVPTGDGMSLKMSIEEDESPLRLGSLEGLENGMLFRVIAVEAGTTKYFSHGDFVYGSGVLWQGSFYVHIGSSYDFICFSYNSDAALPSAASYVKGSVLPTLSMEHAKDLLWWKSPSSVLVNTAADVELEIKLQQQLARVRVVVDCDYNEWVIDDVTDGLVTVSAAGGTMDWTTGVVSSAGAAAARGFTWSDIDDGGVTEQTSDPLMLVPAASAGNVTVSVLANAISRVGFTKTPSTTVSATFSTALKVGFSYTLRMKLWATKWAGSNIYWDNAAQQLTFDEYYPDGDDAPHRGYQGVFFKWGSLVGTTPVGTFSNALYVPVVKSDLNTSTWKATTGAQTSTDTDIDASVRKAYSTWGNIPYMDGGYTYSGSEWTNAYMMAPERNNYDTYKLLRGDICQYLSTKTGAVSGDYRLPRISEYLTAASSGMNFSTPIAGGWIKGPSDNFKQNNGAGYADGTADFTSTANAVNKILGYFINITMGNVTLPASGYRTGGSMAAVGEVGYYWTSSAKGNSGGHYTDFKSNLVQVSYNTSRTYGFPVRCVVND
jgi:hypothetical protein